MLGDSDELDLTDPLRDAGPDDFDTGEWLNSSPVTLPDEPTPLPQFVEIPSAPWLRREQYRPAEELPRESLDPDGGDWSPAPWGYRLTLLLFALAAAVVAFGFFCRTG